LILLRALAAVALVATGCDAVPDLHLVDASVAAGDAGADAVADVGQGGADALADTDTDTDGDTAADGCSGIRCPDCPPNPGQCCADGVPCAGNNCAGDCVSRCSACAEAGLCCSKQGAAAPVCRALDALDAGKCP
jgi:hypothetical protein